MNRAVLWLTLVLSLFLSVPAWAQPMDTPPTFSAVLKSESARPGDTVEGVATVTFGPDLHGYQNPQVDESLIPIELKGKGFDLTSVTYPKGEEKVVGGLPDPYFVHSGTIEIPFTMKVPEDVGAKEITLEFSYQQCDENNCFIPSAVETTVKINVDPSAPASTVANADPNSNDPPVTTPATGATTQPKSDGLGGVLQDAFVKKNWLLLVGLLLVVGLLINLTPCVYPLIPVTISFFAGQAKENSGSKFQLALNYMLGIAFSYGLVGGIAAVSGGFFGQLFSYWWFNALLGVFMIVLALSMFDLYQIGIPQALSKHLKGRSGPVGSFIMGTFVGVGAAPCAGPIIILLFTEVAKLNMPVLAVLTFVLVGLGLGIPYFVLGLVSGGQKVLPKAGGWMKSVKAMMGLAVIYFGVQYFIQAFPAIGPDVVPWVWTAFFGLSGAFLIAWDRGSTDPRTWMVKSAGILLAGVLAGTSLSGTSGRGAEEVVWTKFTEESWATAKQGDRPIFIDGTANWCAECKVIEANIFSKPEFVDLSKKITLMKIDWSTGVDKEYQDYTKNLFDIKGLPHMVITKSNGEVVSVLNSLHSLEELTTELKKAGLSE